MSGSGHGPDLGGYSVQYEILLTINVVGGTGSANFTATGRIKHSCFIPPVVGTYAYDIEDRNGFGVTGFSGMTGKFTDVEEALCFKTNTLTIKGPDGTYSVLLRIHSGVYST